MEAMRTHYEVLGIGKSATASEVKKAYQRKAKQHHPDKGGNHADFVELKLAYEVLSDPVRREAYDRNAPPSPDIESMVEQVFRSFVVTNNVRFSDPVLLTRHHFREQLYLQASHVRRCRETSARWREIARRLHASSAMKKAVREARIRSIADYITIRANRVLLREILDYMADWSYRVEENPIQIVTKGGWRTTQ
jgi:hypothetical protein